MRFLTVLSLAALALAGPINAEAREPRLGAVLSVLNRPGFSGVSII